jgi:hypothetical protein
MLKAAVLAERLKICQKEAQRIVSCRRCIVNWTLPSTYTTATTDSMAALHHHHYNNNSIVRRNAFLVASIVGISSLTICFYIRKLRYQMIEGLPLAATVLSEKEQQELTQLAVRTSLMGRGKSVKGELNDIRKWHQDHGFKGGLVLRELDKPLFWVDASENDHDGIHDNGNNSDSTTSSTTTTPTTSLEELVLDPMRLARRECYYLYYELRGNGHLHQEIFCRGTTLWVDIFTCLQVWMVHDDELECKVHHGFRSHANRLLQDLQPLLAKDQRATISISGHSLGGSVAYILAIKLRKRGFNVVRVRAFGSPRFIGAHGLDTVNSLLPQDNLRVEDDNDFVAYLPPFGQHVGSKLWFPQHHLARYVSWTSNHWWADSFWVNFRPWEIARNKGKSHRVVPNYVQQLDHIMDHGAPDERHDVKLQGSR